MVVIACAGWASNHYAAFAFPGRSDITSGIGGFAVGILGYLYGRISIVSQSPSPHNVFKLKLRYTRWYIRCRVQVFQSLCPERYG